MSDNKFEVYGEYGQRLSAQDRLCLAVDDIDSLESQLAVAVTTLGDIKIYLDASRVEQTPTGYDINGDHIIQWIEEALKKANK